MGFNDTGDTITLTAKLTPYGRQQLLSSSSSLITNFALGDSDTNYEAAKALATGEVPSSSGNLNSNGNSNNSVSKYYTPKSLLSANSVGSKKKLVNIGSSDVINSEKLLTQTTITNLNLSHNLINRTDTQTDSLVNLYYSFKLPITTNDDTLFTVTPSAKGGFADTSMSALSTDNILIIGLDNSLYGEQLDGKSINITLDTTASTFNIYSSYEQTLTKASVQDAKFRDESFNSAVLGGNIAFLFSDSIQKPNNDVSKSWATGFATTKPFSVNRKSQFNMKNDTITSTVADKIVGFVSLDKGFAVITEPTIVDNFTTGTGGTETATTISYNSMVTEVTQQITCVKDRGEFTTTNNATWSKGDTIRITEVLLLDDNDNIIAVAKTDRAISIEAQQFLALGISLTV